MGFAAMHESVPGTKRTWSDVRSESAFRGKAEVRHSSHQVSFGVLFGRGDLTDDVGFWGVKRTHKCPDKTEFRPQTLDFPAGGSTYLAFPAAAASCPGPD